VSLVVATSGSLHQYDRFLVSANVGAHVLLGLVVPALVWAAAPVALIRAAVHPRNDDSTGVREWTDVIVEHPSVRYLAQPFPAFLLAAALWWAFFATDAVRWSVSDPTGRTVSDAVFLLVGLLAVPTLCTPIPAGHRRPTTAAAVVRIVGALVIAAGTVSLGIAMRGPLGLLQASWFGAMGRTWGPDPLVDQARAGLVLIVAGVLLLVTVVVVVLVRLRRDGGDPVGAVDAVAARDAAAGPTTTTTAARADPDDLDFDDGSDDLEPSPGADAR